MKHGHGAGWNQPDSYAFAGSIVEDGTPWCRLGHVVVSGNLAEGVFESERTLDRAVLVSTVDAGITGSRKWHAAEAEVTEEGEYQWRVQVTIPVGTTAWFINVRSGELTVSSDYQQTSLNAGISGEN